MPPSRPSKDEINFTRLLRACEQLASEADGNLLNSTHYAPFKQVRRAIYIYIRARVCVARELRACVRICNVLSAI
jgi:hypothetical protein